MQAGTYSRGIGTLFACLMVGPLLHAQQPTAIQKEKGVYTLHEDTHLVLLDVTVTDKGHPVTGLTRDDFRLLEDGQPQTIKFFEEHAPIDPAEITRQKAAALAAQPPNTFTNDEPFTGRPVTVLLLNELFALRGQPAYVLHEMLDLVQQSPPDTPFAVYVLGQELQLVQPVTTDRALLAAKIQGIDIRKIPPMGWVRQFDPDTRIAMPLDDVINTRRGFMTAAMQQLTAAFKDTPGRKDLFAFTGAFQCSVVLSNGSNGVPACPAYAVAGHDHEFLCGLEDTLEQGRIWMYRYYGPDNIAYGFGCGSTGANVRDLAHYYTLYYAPTNHDWSGKYRATTVEVADREGLKLAYRKGYYGTPENVEAHYYTPGPAPAPVIPDPDEQTIAATTVAAETTTSEDLDASATEAAPNPAKQMLHRHQEEVVAAKTPPNPASSVFSVQVIPAAATEVPASVHSATDKHSAADKAQQEHRQLTLLFTIPANEFKVVQSDSGQYVARLEISAAGYADGKSPETYESQVVATFDGPADPRIGKSTITAKLTMDAPGHGRSRWLEMSVRDMATGQSGSLTIPMGQIKMPPPQ